MCTVSTIKLGRIIKVLEMIDDMREGSPGEKRENNVPSGLLKMAQEDLATKLGINIKTLKNTNKLTNLLTKIQDLIEQQVIFHHIRKQGY